jgi:orotate phosphoribosyltransferase
MVRARLLELLVRHSYRYDPSAPFQLTSGRWSAFYVDCKATTMRGEAMGLVGELVAARLPGDVRAVGGLTMGADPIAFAAALHATQAGRVVHTFSVRKEPKQHGLRKWIEGPVEPGLAVAVVDDVVTTGGSTLEAMRRCREEQLDIRAVVVLIDRQEEGGFAAIRAAAGPDAPVTAIFTRDELQARWLLSPNRG